jgi:microsomal dipeptidase-like Zn-dependent dipeptidase
VITDLHAHYPMRVVSDVTPDTALGVMRKAMRRPTLGDKLRALVLGLASKLFSHSEPFSGYRVTAERLNEGDVGVALSVLYRPAEELDPEARFSSPPKASYFPSLMGDLLAVEDEVATHEPSLIRLAHNTEELDQCLEEGTTALVHCVEGGFHLGEDEDEIDAHVQELASWGVAYITVAHLFFRGVAAVAPALPFLSDSLYSRLFGAREGEGLTEVGAAVVGAMARHRIMVDVSHMRADSIAETLELLDEVDPDRTLPVISTHAGFQCGEQAYMHDQPTVAKIAERDGVIGLIMAEHQLLDGLDVDPPDFARSVEAICRHIDRIAEVTDNHRHVAIGTDFDGFVKPTLAGLQHSGDLAALEAALNEKYGAEIAEQIASKNTLRVLRRLWS